jgi:hypothetical protein
VPVFSSPLQKLAARFMSDKIIEMTLAQVQYLSKVLTVL